MTRLNRYEELIAFLRENNVPHQPDAPNQTVSLPVALPADAGSVFVRWEKDLPYVQVIYAFIGNVPDARAAEVMQAICIVNNTIKLPGFGYEVGSHAIYMRLCVQLYEDGITPTAFQRQVGVVLQNAREFVDAFRDVVAGAPSASVLDLAVQHSRQSG